MFCVRGDFDAKDFSRVTQSKHTALIYLCEKALLQVMHVPNGSAHLMHTECVRLGAQADPVSELQQNQLSRNQFETEEISNG